MVVKVLTALCFGRQFDPKHEHEFGCMHRVKRPPDV